MIAARVGMRVLTLVMAVSLSVLEGTGLTQERGPQRVEGPAPAGEGGTLLVSIDQSLCGQADLILRVMREDRDDGGTRWNVFDTPVMKPCSWTITDLWPGKYDVSVLRESPRQIVALKAFAIDTGVTVVQTLDPSRTEVAGVMTIEGAPAWNLAGLPIFFTSRTQPQMWVETVVDQRGEYRVSLDMDGDVLMSIGGEKGLLNRSKTIKVEPGLNVVNEDFPEGVINLTIVPPQGLTRESRILVDIRHEPPKEVLRKSPYPSSGAGSMHQLPMDATRTYLIVGHGFGRYEIRVGTDAIDPRTSRKIAELVVFLTPDEPRKDIVLEIPALPPPLPRPSINLEACPPPRTAACVNGQ
jgi:hypothetical protein